MREVPGLAPGDVLRDTRDNAVPVWAAIGAPASKAVSQNSELRDIRKVDAAPMRQRPGVGRPARVLAKQMGFSNPRQAVQHEGDEVSVRYGG